ncbi:FAD-binding Berberine family protein [Striga hermonthica]|uniref:FAD-binding Berberine family protein n=1 Tax=Striga hermonthica TaxID=68872 RepID=A0A9N7NI64_STRHE|nr:FAD-binding Berberine family protein [Striga hermonthica]
MKNPNLPLILYFVTTFAFASADNPLYASFVQCLSEQGISNDVASQIVSNPNTPQFSTVLNSYIRNRRFNTSATPRPGLIVAPTSEAHVVAAVVCAVRLEIHLRIRSGGHDYEGTSYVSGERRFAMLDMSNFRSIDVDAAGRTAWVGSGALIGELYYRIWEKSNTLAFPAGVCPTVGVGGHIAGAGYGNMLRKHGVTSDHVLDARVVDASGRILDRASMGEDLFWAIRGGGGASFAVVLAYRIALVPVPPTVTVFQIEKFRSEDAAELVHEYQQAVSAMDDELFVRVLIQPITRNRTRTVRATFIGQYLGPAQNLLNVTARYFPKLGLTISSCHEMPWIQSVLYWDDRTNLTRSPEELLNRNPNSAGYLKRKSDYVKKPIPVNGLNRMFDEIIRVGRVGMVFNSYGGVNSRIPATATPFPHRDGNLFKIQYSVNWDNGSDSEDFVRQSRELYEFMTPYVSENPRQAYFNYRDLDIGVMPAGESSYGQGKVYGEKYFKENFDRLVRIKTRVDPRNFFRNEQSIPTAQRSGGDAVARRVNA